MHHINDQEYWIRRHQEKDGLAAVGMLTSSEESNYWLYQIVLEQYELIFRKLNLPIPPKVLDAGCGIGAYFDFFLARHCIVTAVDVSPEALEKIKTKYGVKVKTFCSPLNNLTLNESFDIVHCFDVLYHILNDREWTQALERLALHSGHYIILHERFLARRQFISARHVNFRTYSVTANKLQALGFTETATIPTHFFASYLFTYFWAKYFPEFFYRLDKKILDFCVRNNHLSWGAYHIKVFEKVK
ncbi:MAG: class I SAM-dependent methyltransferase [Candidatus Schekmanbacteria bacterium]|nr:class I SAM-dependent methyltransferase [Candidatus Schekmanbacteria bacterium]